MFYLLQIINYSRYQSVILSYTLTIRWGAMEDSSVFKQFVQSLEKDYEGFDDRATLLKNLTEVLYNLLPTPPCHWNLYCGLMSEISSWLWGAPDCRAVSYTSISCDAWRGEENVLCTPIWGCAVIIKRIAITVTNRYIPVYTIYFNAPRRYLMVILISWRHYPTLLAKGDTRLKSSILSLLFLKHRYVQSIYSD